MPKNVVVLFIEMLEAQSSVFLASVEGDIKCKSNVSECTLNSVFLNR